MIDEDIFEFVDISEQNETKQVTYGDIKQKQSLLIWILVVALIGVVSVNLATMWANPFIGEIKEMGRLYHAEKKKNVEFQKENAAIRANCEKLMDSIESWRRQYIEVSGCLLAQEPVIKKLILFSNHQNCCHVPPREAQAIVLQLIKMKSFFKAWINIIVSLRK